MIILIVSLGLRGRKKISNVLKYGLRWIFHTNSKWMGESTYRDTHTQLYLASLFDVYVWISVAGTIVWKRFQNVNWFRQHHSCEANNIKYSLSLYLPICNLHYMKYVVFCCARIFFSVIALSSTEHCTLPTYYFVYLRTISKHSTFL